MAEPNETTIQEPRIRIHEIRTRQPTVISGEINLLYKDSQTTVKVGNTGLSIKFLDTGDRYTISGDFEPEGRLDPGFIHPLKALKILCYSVQHFTDFLKSTEKIDIKKIESFEAVTNDVFANFLVRLFEAGGHPDLIKLTSGEYGKIVTMNLKEVLALKDEDKLIETIKTFSDRAENMKFSAMLAV